MFRFSTTIDLQEPNHNRSLYEGVEWHHLPANIREELRRMKYNTDRTQYLRQHYPDDIARPWLDVDPTMWSDFNSAKELEDDYLTWMANNPRVPMGLTEFNQLGAWAQRQNYAEEASKVNNIYSHLSRQEAVKQHLAFVRSVPEHAERSTSLANTMEEFSTRNAAMSELLGANWFNGWVTKADLNALSQSADEAKRKFEQHKADKRQVLQEFRAMLKRVPKRATMTPEFLEDVKQLQEQLKPLFELTSAGWFSDVLTPEEDAEVGALINKASMRFEQYKIDTDNARVRMYRRTLWDFVLIKRLFGR
jgi:hypothetical protein